ncbi:MAG: hypothetical protein MJ182_03495 [Treponema sp.]|nr:hypothetical protein [Treponema sp.]
MAISKKSPPKPVNMADTFNALNNAASGSTVSPQPVVSPAPVVQTTEPVVPAVAKEVPSVNPVKSDGIPTVEQVEASVASSKQESRTPSSPSTEKTMISLRLLKNDKEKFQEFFKSCGLSFTDGLYMAADFIEREVENGRLQMSKSGIQYK